MSHEANSESPGSSSASANISPGTTTEYKNRQEFEQSINDESGTNSTLSETPHSFVSTRDCAGSEATVGTRHNGHGTNNV
jgi:hypothetical protein